MRLRPERQAVRTSPLTNEICARQCVATAHCAADALDLAQLLVKPAAGLRGSQPIKLFRGGVQGLERGRGYPRRPLDRRRRVMKANTRWTR
jgi:hypothetical protein